MVNQNKQTRNLPGGFFKQIEAGKFETTKAVSFNDFTLGQNTTIILKHNLTVNSGKTFTNNGTVIIEHGYKIINNGEYINNGITDSIKPKDEYKDAVPDPKPSGGGTASESLSPGAIAAAVAAAAAIAATADGDEDQPPTPTPAPTPPPTPTSTPPPTPAPTPTSTPTPTLGLYDALPSFEFSNIKYSSPNSNSSSEGKTNVYMKELIELKNDLKKDLDAIQDRDVNGELNKKFTALNNILVQNNTYNKDNYNTYITERDKFNSKKDWNLYNKNADIINNTVVGYNNLKNKDRSKSITFTSLKNNTIFGTNNAIFVNEKDVTKDINGNIIIGNNNFKDSNGNNMKLNNNIVLGNFNQLNFDEPSSSINNNIIIGNYSVLKDINGTNEIVIGNNTNGNGLNTITFGYNLKPNWDCNLGSEEYKFKNIYTDKINDIKLDTNAGKLGDRVILQNNKIQFENVSKNLQQTRDTFSDSSWFPSNNGSTDLGKFSNKFSNKFKSLFLSNGIFIKNKEIIQYPFRQIDSINYPIGMVLNGLEVNSSGDQKVDLKKTGNNININFNDILNCGGRLLLPGNININSNIVFTSKASDMFSKLQLGRNGDFIDNLFISSTSKIFTIKDDLSNIIATNNIKSQYVIKLYDYWTSSKTIPNDMSMRIKIRRITGNKIEISFIPAY